MDLSFYINLLAAEDTNEGTHMLQEFIADGDEYDCITSNSRSVG
jgi:hypothetical protein